MGSSTLFSFAVIADIQYADRENGTNFHQTVVRRYRNSLSILKKAVETWNAEPGEIKFIAQLGDIIDGQNKKLGQSRTALDTVLAELNKCKCKTMYNLIGNHELYNFSRMELSELLNTTREGRHFYSVKPFSGWKLIILDPYDISAMEPASGTQEEAYKTLEAHNPNNVRGPSDWVKGLEGLDRRWLPFNGGIGEVQVEWLREELKAADAEDEKVIILSHIAIAPGACDDQCCVWNYEEVLETCQKSKSVVLVLAGHAHEGGYLHDDCGIHHVTLPSPLEVEGDSVAFGTLDVELDKMVLRGHGVVESRIMKFRDEAKP